MTLESPPADAPAQPLDQVEGRPRRSASAERMRRSRERRKSKLTCLTIELREHEIAGLVRWAFLAPDKTDDRRAVAEALYKWFDKVFLRL